MFHTCRVYIGLIENTTLRSCIEGVDEHSDDPCESDSDEDLECLRRLALFSSTASTYPGNSALYRCLFYSVAQFRLKMAAYFICLFFPTDYISVLRALV